MPPISKKPKREIQNISKNSAVVSFSDVHERVGYICTIGIKDILENNKGHKPKITRLESGEEIRLVNQQLFPISLLIRSNLRLELKYVCNYTMLKTFRVAHCVSSVFSLLAVVMNSEITCTSFSGGCIKKKMLDSSKGE